MSFEPGQRVVCVRNDFEPTSEGIHVDIPTVGAVYRVNDFIPAKTEMPHPRYGRCTYQFDLVAVEGLNASPFPGYDKEAFRPIRPKEQAAHESWSELLRNPQPEGVE